MAATCGGFQFVMPLLGWYCGLAALDYIANYDHWLAFVLLCLVGGNMIRGSMRPEDKTLPFADPTLSLALFWVGAATSIDAAAVGTGFSAIGSSPLHLAVCAGLFTAQLSFLGVKIGGRVGELLGRKMELLGGVCLCVIGAGILMEHLNA
jgi:putative Mn2+ efflux pump MntP